MDNGPEVINMTSNASTNLLNEGHTTLRSTSSLAALNNGGGGGTLPRSSLVRNYAHSHHGTLKKSADELRPLTAMDGHYEGHRHKPSMDTLRRVHFEKTTSSPSNNVTPASPPKISLPPNNSTNSEPVTSQAPINNQTHDDEDDDEGDTAM